MCRIWHYAHTVGLKNSMCVRWKNYIQMLRKMFINDRTYLHYQIRRCLCVGIFLSPVCIHMQMCTCVFSTMNTQRCKPNVPQESLLETCGGQHMLSVTSGQNWKWDGLVFHFHVLQLWKEREGLDFMAWKREEVQRATKPGCWKPHKHIHMHKH